MSQALTETQPERHSLVQFAQFCIVGLTSFVIDAGISNYLRLHLGVELHFARVISFSVAVLNGYIWNSIWTFKGMGAGKRHEQAVKFLAVNLVGLVLNLIIMSILYSLMAGRLSLTIQPNRIQYWIGFVTATGCVSVWNFVANKKWTFSGIPTEF